MPAPTLDDVLAYAADFERSYVAVVHGRIKLRVGKIVYVAFSHDETVMGFAYPKLERDALIASDPKTFLLPRPSDLRFNWVLARLNRLDHAEMREFVLDAWGMVVPKFLFRRRLELLGAPAPAISAVYPNNSAGGVSRVNQQQATSPVSRRARGTNTDDRHDRPVRPRR